LDNLGKWARYGLMKKVFYSTLLVVIGLVIGRLLCASPDGELECAKLPTSEGVKVCLRNLYRSVKASPTPIPWNTNPETKRAIKCNCEVEYDDRDQWFSGVITNNGKRTILKALYSLQFYDKGDDPKDHMPIAYADVLIEGPIDPSKSLRFKVKDFEKNWWYKDNKEPPLKSGAIQFWLQAVELDNEWVDIPDPK
jgi:hypothetical protein